MTKEYNEHCPYCDTEYYVEFENDDDILMHCPACGEEVLFSDDNLDIIDDEEDDEET